LYVELAERLGESLDRPVETVWYLTEYAKRALRNTLLAGQCDLFVGLPARGFMEQRLAMSKPFATLRYALVTDARTPVNAGEDLVGRRVAVQFATPPHYMVVALDGVLPITVRTADEGMQALAEGRVDVAYLWGPRAGYLNRAEYGERFRVQPTDGKDFAWPVAVAFRRQDAALREDVQRELDKLGPWIAEAEARYGFPDQGTPGTLTDATAAAPMRLAQATPAPGASGTAPPDAGAASVERGRELFNSNCSHCHGPDAASPDPHIDLRRLARRYHEDKDKVFDETVHKGRPDKGMPTWGGVLPEADIAQIKAYVDSVQVKK
jgi:mono/diheme cytochrome c family protein